MLATKQVVRVEESQVHSRQTNLRVRQQPKEMSLGDRIVIFSAVAISAVSVWFIASVGARIDGLNYSIDNLQSQVQKDAANNASLNAQVDQLSQPSRILSIALGSLHMQYKSPVQVGAPSASPSNPSQH